MDYKVILTIVAIWIVREFFAARKLRGLEDQLASYYTKILDERRKNATKDVNDARDKYLEYFDKYGAGGPKGGSA